MHENKYIKLNHFREPVNDVCAVQQRGFMNTDSIRDPHP